MRELVPETRVHPETGLTLCRGVRAMTLTYRGQSIIVNMPGWYPDDDSEGIISCNDMKVSDRALNRMKARVEGLLEPEDIKRIRKKLHLTQAEAGKLIGGGLRAFQKYESGDSLPSQGTNNVLLLLDHDPNGLAVLRKSKSRSALTIGTDANRVMP